MYSVMVYFSHGLFLCHRLGYFNNFLVIKEYFVDALSLTEECFILYKGGETLLPRQHFISTKIPRVQFGMSFSQVVKNSLQM